MLVGTRISPEWLERPDDLRFLRQVGVDVVDITMSLIPGYDETGRLSRDGVEHAVSRLADAELRIERINSTGDATRCTFLGLPGSAEELDNLAHNAQICVDFGLPVLGVQCFQASTFGHFPKPAHSWVEGRGGYQHLHSDLSEALRERPAPEGSPTHEELWERTGHVGSIHAQSLPRWDEAIAAIEEATLVVQVNGKLRDRIAVSAGIGEEEAKAAALASDKVRAYTEGKTVDKVVFVPGRYIVSVVVKG